MLRLRSAMLKLDETAAGADATAAALTAVELACARRSTVDLAPFTHIRSDPPRPRPIQFQPYDYQADFWDRIDGGRSIIVLKARQLGMSWAIALYMLRRAQYDHWRIGYWSMGDREVRYQLEQRVDVLAQSLPAPLTVPSRASGSQRYYRGGGEIHGFPATQKSGTSYTFDAVVFDEFAMHAYAADNLAHVAPAISAGGQLIIVSTANPALGPHGAFYELWQAASGVGEPPAEPETGQVIHEVGALEPVFLPWHIRPGRDEEWLERQRALYRSLDDAAFAAFYPESPHEAFVGRAGTVYPQFSPERHVRPAPVPWEHCIYRVAGYDLGGGDPNAIVVLGAWKDGAGRWHVHQYGEWYERGLVSVEVVNEVLAQWPGLDHVAGDPREPSMVASLQSLGWPAAVADWRRGEGLGVIADWLHGHAVSLTIDPRCVASIAEFPGYRWATRVDPSSRDRYATGRPVDHHADAMDARRYAAMWLHHVLLAQLPPEEQPAQFERWRW